jgi:hypothetical protein
LKFAKNKLVTIPVFVIFILLLYLL